MEAAGIDACGELGEYHTVVTGGPLFVSWRDLGVRGRKILETHSLLDTTERSAGT